MAGYQHIPKGGRLLFDSWEAEAEDDYVLFRLYKAAGPPGNGHDFKIDGLGAMQMGRGLLAEGAKAEMTRQDMVEAEEERKRQRKSRRGFWRKDDKL